MQVERFHRALQTGGYGCKFASFGASPSLLKIPLSMLDQDHTKMIYRELTLEEAMQFVQQMILAIETLREFQSWSQGHP